MCTRDAAADPGHLHGVSQGRAGETSIHGPDGTPTQGRTATAGDRTGTDGGKDHGTPSKTARGAMSTGAWWRGGMNEQRETRRTHQSTSMLNAPSLNGTGADPFGPSPITPKPAHEHPYEQSAGAHGGA